jgi:hypothetical protein
MGEQLDFTRAIELIRDLRFELAHIQLLLEHIPMTPLDPLLQERHRREVPPPGQVAIQTVHADA